MAPMSQFGRARRELGVELIPARSPQAKGRIERRFHTLQDRQLYQIQDHVLVEERVDGTMRMLHGDRRLSYQRIVKRPPSLVSPKSPRRPRPLVQAEA
jgi:hypothetical protein